MEDKYFDENGNSLNPSSYDKKDRDERVLLQKILSQKNQGTRPKPSDNFIHLSHTLTVEKRIKIINLAGKLCDEDFYGRTSLCQQFAILVKYMLQKEGIPSKIFTGEVKYFNSTKQFFWKHFWVELNNNQEIIDCNVDSMVDNPKVPAYLEPKNFWGLKSSLPADRVFGISQEFTALEEESLEKDDNETLIWKQKIDEMYI